MYIFPNTSPYDNILFIFEWQTNILFIFVYMVLHVRQVLYRRKSGELGYPPHISHSKTFHFSTICF